MAWFIPEHLAHDGDGLISGLELRPTLLKHHLPRGLANVLLAAEECVNSLSLLLELLRAEFSLGLLCARFLFLLLLASEILDSSQGLGGLSMKGLGSGAIQVLQLPRDFPA